MGPSFQGNPEKIVKGITGALGATGVGAAAGGGLSGTAIAAAATAAAPWVIGAAVVIGVGALLFRKKKK